MEALKNILDQAQPQGNQPTQWPTTAPSHDLPELSAEESEAVILAARKAKAHNMAREAYRLKVMAEPVEIQLTPTQLGDFVRAQFQRQNGREFVIDEVNAETFNTLCHYFTGTPKQGIDLNKGLLLLGNIGVGKTEMIKLFTTNPHASFGFVGCRSVSDGFSFTSKEENPEEHLRTFSFLRKASKPHPYNAEFIGVCFDDLGTETIPAMNFGNQKNVMAEIIMNRYDNRLPFNMTHLVTNLKTDEIVKLYGPRFNDRVGQMMNRIIFPQVESRRL